MEFLVETLGAIGEQAEGGIIRHVYDEAWVAARRQVADWMREAMRAVGLAPERYREAIRDDVDAFVELHIEQGRIMFDEHVPLGIVDAITGLYRFRTTVEGRTDHAGTTPMDLRRDALQAAVHMASDMTRIVADAGRPAVVTNGWWDVRPGAWNIVPGLGHCSVDLRHPGEA